MSSHRTVGMAKSPGASKSKYVTQKSINKIQGGGENGNDLVELNVNFKANPEMGQSVISQQISPFGKSTMMSGSIQVGPHLDVPNQKMNLQQHGLMITTKLNSTQVGNQNDSHLDSIANKQLTDLENETLNLHNPRSSIGTNQSPSPVRNQKNLFHHSPNRKTESKSPNILEKTRISEGTLNVKNLLSNDPLKTISNDKLAAGSQIQNNILLNFDGGSQGNYLNMEGIGDIDNKNDITDSKEQVLQEIQDMQQFGENQSKNTYFTKTPKSNQRRRNNNKSKQRQSSGNSTNGAVIQIRKGKPIDHFIKQLKNQKFSQTKTPDKIPTPASSFFISRSKANETQQRNKISSDIMVKKLNPNWKSSKANFQTLEQAGCGTKKVPGKKDSYKHHQPKISTKIAMTQDSREEPHIETNLRNNVISDDKIKTEMIDATLSAQNSARENEVIFSDGRQEVLEEVEGKKRVKTKKSMPIQKEIQEQLSIGVETSTPINKSVQKKLDDSTMVLDQIKHCTEKDPIGASPNAKLANKRVILSTSQTGNSVVVNLNSLQQKSIDQNEHIQEQNKNTDGDNQALIQLAKDNLPQSVSDIDGSDNIQSSSQSHIKHNIKESQRDEQIDHYNHMMSPKGIQSNSETVSVKQSQNITDFIKVLEINETPNSSQKRMDEKEHEAQLESQNESAIEPKTSLFTQSQINSERVSIKIEEGKRKSVFVNEQDAHDSPPIKKMRTQAHKNKKVKMNQLKVGEMRMVDIDQVDYTERENDSNAYHKGHSEMMRDAEGSAINSFQKKASDNIKQSDNSNPIQTQSIQHSQFKDDTQKINKVDIKIKISEPTELSKYESLPSLNSQDKDPMFTNDKINPTLIECGTDSNNENNTQDKGPNYLTVNEINQNKSLKINRSETKLDKQSSQIVSESLLDCRDFGTNPLNGEEIDQYIRNSQELLRTTIPVQENKKPEPDYKPIQQVNVLLVNADNKIDITPKEPERKNSNQMDESSNAVLTNQKIRNGMTGESYRSNGEIATGVSGIFSGVISRISMPGMSDVSHLNQTKSSYYPRNRQKQLFDYLGRNQRIILKSPNPNDAKKIVLAGSNIQQEADILLNGRIYTDKYKQKQYSPQEQKQLPATQFTRQTQLQGSRVERNFQLSGKHFDTKDEQIMSTYEQVKSQILNKNQNTQNKTLVNEKQMLQLQNELKNLSLEQLQNIYQYLVKSGQISINQSASAKSTYQQIQQFKSKSANTSEHINKTEQNNLNNQAEKKMSKKDLLCDPNLMSFMTELMNRNPEMKSSGGSYIIMNQMTPSGTGFDHLQSGEMNYDVQNHPSTMLGQHHIMYADSSNVRSRKRGESPSGRTYGSSNPKMQQANATLSERGIINLQAGTIGNMSQTHANIPSSMLTGFHVNNLHINEQLQLVNQTSTPPIIEVGKVGFGELEEPIQSNFTETLKRGTIPLPETGDQNSKNISRLGIHKASQHIGRLPNGNLMHLDDQETDKQTVYLTTQNAIPNGQTKLGKQKYSQSFRQNGNTTSINMNNQLLLEDHDIQTGMETVSNSFDKEQQQYQHVNNQKQQLPPQQKYKSFKVPQIQLEKSGQLKKVQGAGLHSEVEMKTLNKQNQLKDEITNFALNSEQTKQKEETQTQMTIIGEKTADAELICGISSVISSLKNLNNMVVPANTKLDDTLEGQRSDKEIYNLQKLQGQFRVNQLSKMNEDLQYEKQKLSNGNEISPRETFMATRLKVQGKSPVQSPLYADPKRYLHHSRLHNIQSELNPQIEILKSFTPNQQLISAAESFDKVQQIAAEIQVSKKFQPEEDFFNSIVDHLPNGNSAAYGTIQHEIKPPLQPKLQEKRGMSANDVNLVQPQQQYYGTQRLNKKTLVHSDIAQYELYMRMQKIQRLGLSREEARRNTIDFKNQLVNEKNPEIKVSKRQNQVNKSFFDQVSRTMKEVFSPMHNTIESQRIDIEEAEILSSKNIGTSSRRSGQEQAQFPQSIISLKKDFSKSRSKSKSKESRGKGKKLINVTSQNLTATGQRGSLIGGLNNQGLYQQSYHPANRMIQREKYLQQQEQMYTKSHLHINRGFNQTKVINVLSSPVSLEGHGFVMEPKQGFSTEEQEENSVRYQETLNGTNEGQHDNTKPIIKNDKIRSQNQFGFGRNNKELPRPASLDQRGSPKRLLNSLNSQVQQTQPQDPDLTRRFTPGESISNISEKTKGSHLSRETVKIVVNGKDQKNFIKINNS